MTFNTTDLSIAMLRRAGLVERGFFVDAGRDVRRRVFLTQAIDRALMQPHANAVATQLTLDNFRAGWLVSVSRWRNAKADLKRLEDVDEVWAMSFRKPRMDQRRLLGRFIVGNIFVGLGLHGREDLTGKRYSDSANDVIAAWEDRLGCEPLRSPSFADYLSQPFRDLDNDD